MDTKKIELEIRGLLTEAKAITSAATDEDRGLTKAEKATIDTNLAKVASLRVERDANAVRAGVGTVDGFKALAQGLIANGKAETRLKAVTIDEPSAATTLVEPGITGLPLDTRYIYPVFPSSDPGAVLAVTDFRMVGREVHGSGDFSDVERAPLDTTEKAELDVTVEGFTEDMRQLAVMVRDVPNALFAAEASLAGLLRGELQKALNQALDLHVVNAIASASPQHGGTGATVEAKIRSGISELQAVGCNPDVVAISPADSEEVDLHTAVDSIVKFPFGLRVVVTPDVDDGAPLLIDTSVIGHLYKGGLDVAADPYTGFSQNTTDLRAEFNCLAVIRNVTGAFIADGGGS